MNSSTHRSILTSGRIGTVDQMGGGVLGVDIMRVDVLGVEDIRLIITVYIRFLKKQPDT